MASADDDLVVDLLLPRPATGVPDEAVEALRARELDEAIEALPPPTSCDPAYEQRVDVLFDVAAGDDRDAIARAYRAGGLWDRTRMAQAVAAEHSLDWVRAWQDAGTHPDVAACCLGVALRDAGLQAEADSPEWASDPVSGAYLSWADDVLTEAARQYPGDLTPLVLAQRTVTPQRATRDDVWAKAAAWQRIDPWCVEGWCWLLQELRADRFGAAGELEEALRRIVAEAPDAHPVLALVPFGVCELYAAELADAGAGAGADRAFTDHVELVLRALQRSFAHPAWRPVSDEVLWRNCFAMALFYGNADAEAWREFTLLQGRWTPYPWNLKSDYPLAAYQHARAWLVRHLVGATP